MPRKHELRSLTVAAHEGGISVRLIQQWLTDGKLKRWAIPGDRRRYVDMAELRELLKPRPVEG